MILDGLCARTPSSRRQASGSSSSSTYSPIPPSASPPAWATRSASPCQASQRSRAQQVPGAEFSASFGGSIRNHTDQLKKPAFSVTSSMGDALCFTLLGKSEVAGTAGAGAAFSASFGGSIRNHTDQLKNPPSASPPAWATRSASPCQASQRLRSQQGPGAEFSASFGGSIRNHTDQLKKPAFSVTFSMGDALCFTLRGKSEVAVTAGARRRIFGLIWGIDQKSYHTDQLKKTDFSVTSSPATPFASPCQASQRSRSQQGPGAEFSASFGGSIRNHTDQLKKHAFSMGDALCFTLLGKSEVPVTQGPGAEFSAPIGGIDQKSHHAQKWPIFRTLFSKLSHYLFRYFWSFKVWGSGFKLIFLRCW